MIRRHHAPHLRLLAIAAVIWLALPLTAWAWGAGTHHYIAQNYSKSLPSFMDGLRTYDSVVDLHVTDPDTRKGSTPGEAPKHFMDVDWYPEFLAGTLTHSRSALEAQYGATTVSANGVLPWAIGDAMTTLTSQFQAQQWSSAALTIADLCHYVGDLNQPLHCTQNYDGAMTGNSGIHSRYETSMMTTYLGQLTTPATPVTYYASPVDAVFDTLTASWGGVSGILAADNTAKAASGGSYNSTYYASLWNSTQAMTRLRVNAAAAMTASMVYTAWRNAGEPTVPGSTTGVAPALATGVRLDAGPTLFHDRLTVRYAGAGPLSVDVLDVRGARVARLVEGASGAGSVTWGRSGATGPVAPGMYFVRLTGPGVNMVRRVTLLD